MLTTEQRKARSGRIGGTTANTLMSGDERRIYNEFLRIIGDPSYQEEDLSNNWPVQFGSYIEKFALDWYQKQSGDPLTMRGKPVVHPQRSYVGVTLDSVCVPKSLVIDCKAPGAHRRLDDVISRNVPQLVLQRACTGTQNAALLIVHGGSEPELYPVSWDEAYEKQLWEVVDQFWNCVITLTPPNGFQPIAAPVRALKIYEMDGRNDWGSEAAVWLENYKSAKLAMKSEKNLKAMVPADAKIAQGNGVTISRYRSGRMSLRESASNDG